MGKRIKERKYKVIELNGSAGLTTTIDEEDWEKIKDYKWYSKLIPRYRGKYHAMAGATNEYGRPTTVSLHRIIMDAPKGKQVDHINGDSLDNRKENLRICTPSQNRANQRAPSRNKHGYMGVAKIGPSYYGRVTCRGKTHNMGPYETAKEAARAYDRKKLEKFGAFAKTNGLENWWSAEEKATAKKFRMDPWELYGDE